MYNSKLLDLIRIFDNRELKLLVKFANSPYHNEHDKVIKLLDYILNAGLHNKTKLTKEKAFANLFPKTKYQDLKIRHVMSYLLELTERFILHESIKEDSELQNIRRLKTFREKNAIRQFEYAKKKAKQPIENKTSQKQVYYQFRLSQELQLYYSNKERTNVSHLQQLHENLDIFYFIQKLQSACTSINLARLYKKEIKIGFIQPIITFIDEDIALLNHQLLSIYYHAYLMLLNNNEESYKRFNEVLTQAIKQVSITDIKDPFLLSINFCIQRINEGNQKYYEFIFNLYRLGIEEGILLENNELSYVTYSNVITVGLRLKEFKETKQFIEEKKELLNTKDRQDYYIFNLSKFHFETKNFERVTSLFFDYKMKEVLLQIQSRIIQIKAFYELDELELCRTLNENLKQSISRKGILAYHKENYRNVNRFVKRLLNVNPYDKKRIELLEKKVTDTNPLTEKKWILEKLKEL